MAPPSGPILAPAHAGIGVGVKPPGLQPALHSSRGTARLRWLFYGTGTNRRARKCCPSFATAVIVLTLLVVVLHFAGQYATILKSFTKQFRGEDLDSGLRAELEELRKWHADYKKQQEAFQASAVDSYNRKKELRELRSKIKEQDEEMATLRLNLFDTKNELKRVVDAKAKLEEILQERNHTAKAVPAQQVAFVP